MYSKWEIKTPTYICWNRIKDYNNWACKLFCVKSVSNDRIWWVTVLSNDTVTFVYHIIIYLIVNVLVKPSLQRWFED